MDFERRSSGLTRDEEFFSADTCHLLLAICLFRFIRGSTGMEVINIEGSFEGYF